MTCQGAVVHMTLIMMIPSLSVYFIYPRLTNQAQEKANQDERRQIPIIFKNPGMACEICFEVACYDSNFLLLDDTDT